MSQIILDSANDLIQGDFDNATLSQRTRLQTSTTNATTGVYVVPNGTATSASVQVSNAADPTNASKVVLATNGSTDTQIVSGANGSGTYLPLSIYTNNDIRLQVNNSGALGVRTGPGTVGFGTSGQFLTSNGSGAGVSWTSIPAGGQLQTEIFTAPGTWTKPASCTQVRVTVVGGGGGGSKHIPSSATPGKPAGAGGYAAAIVPVSAPVTITIGSGGAGNSSPAGGNGSPGTTSSFGPAVSATGGAGGTTAAAGNPGVGTVSTGTIVRTADISTSDITTFLGGGPQGVNLPAAIAYSTTNTFGAGSIGTTVVNSSPNLAGGGVGGAILVEFVG